LKLLSRISLITSYKLDASLIIKNILEVDIDTIYNSGKIIFYSPYVTTVKYSDFKVTTSLL
jgi:hypothetical protein